MEITNPLFGNVVKDINTFFLPNPLAASIEALPILQRTFIFFSDRTLGVGDVRSLKPVFLTSGRVKIEGTEWNFFVRDRGIKVGDVLLLKVLTKDLPTNIRVTVIRLKTDSTHRTVIPPLPPPPPPPQPPQPQDGYSIYGFRLQPFLCVKQLNRSDTSRRRRQQLQLPREIAEAVTPGELNSNDFVIRVRDQTYEYIYVVAKLQLRADGEVLFGDSWPEFVDYRGLQAEDIVVFCVDLARRMSFHVHDFFIPFPPYDDYP